MANEKIVLEVDVKGNAADQIDKAVKSTQSLKSELRSLTQELQGLEPGSKRFTELTQKAGQLKDKIADTSAVIQATAGSPLENLGKGLSGVASIGVRGFQGIVSAQALVGTESKALQATMVKLQAVAGLASAIESLGAMGDTITNIKAGFGSFVTSAKAGLTGIKGAVAATGIGLLLIAVVTMAAYWDEIKAAVSGVSQEQAKLNALAEANVASENKKLESLNSSDNILRLQGLSEKQILELKIKQLDANIKATEAQIEQGRITFEAQYAAEKRNRDILKGILTFIQAPLLVVLSAIDEIAAFAGFDTNLAGGLLDFESSFLFDEDAVKANYLKTYNEQKTTLTKLKNDKAGFELEIQKIDKQAAEERVRIAADGAAKSKANDADRLAGKRELEDALLAIMEDGLEKELLANKYKFERQREDNDLLVKDGKLKAKERTAINAALVTEQEQQATKIREGEQKRLFDKENELALSAASELAQTYALEDEKSEAKKKARDKEISRMKDGVDKEKAILESAFEDEVKEYTKRQRERTANTEAAFLEDKKTLQTALLEKKITQEQYDTFLKDSEKAKNDELLIINGEYNAEVVAATEVKNEDIAALNKQAAIAERNEKIDTLKSIMDGIEAVASEGSAAINSVLQGALGGVASFLEILNTDFKEGLEGTMEKIGAYAAAIGGVLQSFVTAADEANQERLDNQLANLETQTEKEKELLKGQYDNGLITKQEFEAQSAGIDKAAKATKEAAERTAFEKDKKIKIASAAIAGLQGAVQAFTSAFSLGPIAGPIVGAILVASIASMTAMNIAKIKASKYEGGGDGGGGSLAAPGGGGSSVGGAAPTPPSLSLFGQALPGSEGAGQQGPGMRQQTIRAVVVESDITGTQNRLQNYQQRAEVG